MLKQRIITSLVLAPLALVGVFWLPLSSFALFVTLIVSLGAWEWANLSGCKGRVVQGAYTAFIGLCCILSLYARGEIDSQQINEDAMEQHLSTAGLPAPDLLIRTSGEQRISNFMLWQCAYSEFYFTDTLWPDFGRDALQQALLSYARRQRRFGKTSEQVEAEILC